MVIGLNAGGFKVAHASRPAEFLARTFVTTKSVHLCLPTTRVMRAIARHARGEAQSKLMGARMHHQHMTHDALLVVLSFVVALLASYAALDMGTRLRRAAGNARLFWLCGSAVVLGGGIWSMHFIAMLAMSAGVPIGYDFYLTALSLLTAIGIVAFGFYLVTRVNPSVTRLVVAGCVVGGGVAAMHYTGMSALILDGTVHYNPVLVAASIVVAIVAATAALWLTLNLTRPWQRMAAAVVMAVAVCGMHYTAMLATSIEMSGANTVVVDPQSRLILAAAVSIGLLLILCLAMVCVFADRRFEFLAEREAEGLRAANKALTDSQGAMRNLLDNADQGFLTVSANFLVGDQSSAACETIFGAAPSGNSILDLLCREAPHDAASGIGVTLQSVFRDSSDFARELKLELLPKEFSVDGKFVRASYKYLAESGRLMLILTDVTQTRLLIQQVECEHKRLEMIVLAFTEGEAFFALVSEYRRFLTDELTQLILRIEDAASPHDLYRRLHTYKGLLAQFSFHHSPICLHEVETKLSSADGWTVRAAREAFGSEALLAALDRDLAGVTDVLGPDFAPSGRRVSLSRQQLHAMEQLVRAALAEGGDKASSPPLRLLLQTLADLDRLDVKAALALHSRGALSVAARLGKRLAPIAIHGDDVALPPDLYGEFLRSLVHVFRNAIDHGIESEDERALAGKPEEGSIRCDICDHGDRIEILISDDGRGVDRSQLEDKLVVAGATRLSAESESLEDLVFCEGLSSLDTANEISGRGIGLAAVRSELERLAGSVSIETERGLGTRFRFCLPIGEQDALGRSAMIAERIAI